MNLIIAGLISYNNLTIFYIKIRFTYNFNRGNIYINIILFYKNILVFFVEPI